MSFLGALLENLRLLPRRAWRELRPGRDPLPPGGDEASRRLRRAFVLHLHPLRVTERALSPWVTLGLGLLTGTLFLALALSGALLMVYYVPSPERAHASMLDLQHAVAFGAFLRAVHRWAAHGMLVTVGLHLLRVTAQGAYRRRELNWLLGLGLLGTTLGLAFTGYLLPWDQRSFWAVTVSANLLDHVPWLGAWLKALFLGGDQVGPAALVRFYALHVAVLPALLLGLLALHLWRLRKDGGLAASAGQPALVPAWPHLVLREAAVALAALAAVCTLAALLDAPLGAPIDPHLPSNPEKAPWYFVWVQEMVSYSAPVGGVIFPGLLGLLLCLLPFLDREDEGLGRWFGPGRVRAWALGWGGAGLLAFVAFEALYLGAQAGGDAPASDLWNPATGMLLVAGLAFLGAGTLARSTRAACLACLLVLLVALVGFMAVGQCRGPDWVFYWPWEAWPGGV
ncbi:MAG TPA: cytochrome b N-terminal domain-containing protein [Myxococcota bacterium]|nr:cytochrome b N-terminal domain-containing protein [Myxococcota bacterium]HRY95161.1 cytochrome b N-terminal domain-containing protein [Myxococcota bacterium]HSA20918.1 cytochrome b N-terminal domain-containing protein [Myxococcota bacterium]